MQRRRSTTQKPKKSTSRTGPDSRSRPISPDNVSLTPSEPQRIQKILAAAGIASRRHVENWIVEGRVKVNGLPAVLGQKVSIGDKVEVDGRPIHLDKRLDQTPKVIAYNKPEGRITSRHDPEGRDTVFSDLPELHRGRWIAIGRLDINTSGLLLFTNDGRLADRLMHPSTGISREYACRILGEVTPEITQALLRGVKLEDGLAKFDSVEQQPGGEGANIWYHVSLREGRNREVRRLWESQQLQVSRLIRLRYGPIRLDRYLSRGQSRYLKPGEVRALYQEAGIPLTEETR